MLNRAVQGTPEDEDGGFLQVSNIFFEIKNRRVQKVRIGKDKTPLEPDQIYTVVVPNFIATGGNGHTIFKDKPQVKTGLPLRELIVDTVKQHDMISAKVEGRIMHLN